VPSPLCSPLVLPTPRPPSHAPFLYTTLFRSFEFGNRLAGVELPVHSPAAIGCGGLFWMVAKDHRQTVLEERDRSGVKSQAGCGACRISVRTWVGVVAWIELGAPAVRARRTVVSVVGEAVHDQIEDLIALRRGLDPGDHIVEILAFGQGGLDRFFFRLGGVLAHERGSIAECGVRFVLLLDELLEHTDITGEAFGVRLQNQCRDLRALRLPVAVDAAVALLDA